METNKIIILPTPPTPTSVTKNNTKKIEKEPIKRLITTTPKWTFSQMDLHENNQIHHLCDPMKQPFIYQQIRNKLSSYRSQDIDKNLFIPSQIMDVSGVLHKIEAAKGLCFYCKSPVYILYDNVREPKQWTLERLNNKQGHIFENVEIACLSCNLRRRTMKYEKYIMTKEIKIVRKVGRETYGSPDIGLPEGMSTAVPEGGWTPSLSYKDSSHIVIKEC